MSGTGSKFIVFSPSRSLTVFYTGRAGAGWVSSAKTEAFTYSTRTEAERKAALFNRATVLHGLVFEVLETEEA